MLDEVFHRVLDTHAGRGFFAESGARFTDDGENRALDRLHDRFIGHFLRGKERVREIHRVKKFLVFEAKGEAFEDLRGDDAGIPARAHEKAAAETRAKAEQVVVFRGVLDFLDA